VARSDSWVAEQLGIAEKIIPIDRAELDKDIAKAQTSAKSEEVLLSARKLLSYGRYDESAKLFTRALDMPGTPRNEALQRLGMAQVGMGDYDAAVATFNQVDGTRAPVARLWAAYALQRKKGVDVVS
jgi:tetratricopeptide (TPR) repeat protein